MLGRVFHAMGTDVELLVDAEQADDALDAAECEFHRLEALLSRFRPDSELSRLNFGRELEAGPDLLRVVALALEARDRTGGRFDPTLHDALVAAGYDRSFELVAASSGPVATSAPPRRAAAAVVADVVVVDGVIRLGEGVRLDLGGIGKGYAAERAAELLATAGACLVSAGGDVATRGGSWPVGVETMTVELTAGGLATSGRDRRTWRRGGRELHHLIDPHTGAPADSDLVRVTAIAPDAVEAEVTAKSLFLAGAERASAEADRAGIPAVLVTADGRTLLAGGLAA
jgi:thiamine biosynthesis lipoprotein